MREILFELQIENAGKDKSFSKLNWASEIIYCVLFTELPVSHLQGEINLFVAKSNWNVNKRFV